MTTYAVEIDNGSGESNHVPLNAKTDKAAITAMRSYVARNKQTGNLLFLHWRRDTDGCQGYINADGNVSATGKSWI